MGSPRSASTVVTCTCGYRSRNAATSRPPTCSTVSGSVPTVRVATLAARARRRSACSSRALALAWSASPAAVRVTPCGVWCRSRTDAEVGLQRAQGTVSAAAGTCAGVPRPAGRGAPPRPRRSRGTRRSTPATIPQDAGIRAQWVSGLRKRSWTRRSRSATIDAGRRVTAPGAGREGRRAVGDLALTMRITRSTPARALLDGRIGFTGIDPTMGTAATLPEIFERLVHGRITTPRSSASRTLPADTRGRRAVRRPTCLPGTGSSGTLPCSRQRRERHRAARMSSTGPSASSRDLRPGPRCLDQGWLCHWTSTASTTKNRSGHQRPLDRPAAPFDFGAQAAPGGRRGDGTQNARRSPQCWRPGRASSMRRTTQPTSTGAAGALPGPDDGAVGDDQWSERGGATRVGRRTGGPTGWPPTARRSTPSCAITTSRGCRRDVSRSRRSSRPRCSAPDSRPAVAGSVKVGGAAAFEESRKTVSRQMPWCRPMRSRTPRVR